MRSLIISDNSYAITSNNAKIELLSSQVDDESVIMIVKNRDSTHISCAKITKQTELLFTDMFNNFFVEFNSSLDIVLIASSNTNLLKQILAELENYSVNEVEIHLFTGAVIIDAKNNKIIKSQDVNFQTLAQSNNEQESKPLLLVYNCDLEIDEANSHGFVANYLQKKQTTQEITRR